jgi:hypothetical protein
MENTADLFHPEYVSLALAAGTVAVFVDGALCDDLEPMEIVRAGWPDFGRAMLVYHAERHGDGGLPSYHGRRGCDDVEDRFGMGSQVSVRQLLNGTGPEPAVAELPIFVGTIEGIETQLQAAPADSESRMRAKNVSPLWRDESGTQDLVSLRVRDFSAVLERVTVYGRHIRSAAEELVFLPGLDMTFNPGGRGNAATESVMVQGRECAAFCADAAAARAWKLAEVIDYLLNLYLPAGALHWPDPALLLAMTQGRLARDLDLGGLSLLEALHRCCEAADFQFRFVPRLVEGEPAQAIVFYQNGRGRTVELNCQLTGEPLSLSRTNIAAVHSRRDFYPVTHRYIGQGDFRVYEATFELVKAWDPALAGTSYDTFSPSTNPEFYRVRDVYRKWCLNEAGDYSGQPYNQGEPYDFAPLFEGASMVCRRRRFWPTLSTDSQGRPLGYFLEVSFDGENWWQYLYAFNNLLDECGVWLSSEQLDVNTWVAALKGVLRFRITTSVVSDERLTCVVADGPVGSVTPVVDHVVTLPRQFQYRKVSAKSVLAGAGEGFGKPDEADDSTALCEFTRRQAAASAAVIERSHVQTPTLELHFEPGDRVTSSPDSRDLLSCRRDSRSLIWIDRVHMDFRNQCTRLDIMRQRNMQLW